ncbi:putative metallophosphoesterase [mine drainage metagenome]|jgi:predicted MPP superfamily phosphohydrolase|uniref:Putative metallophosphoesterase n=1 Tax=mine drainage metagenome TaxID=410659 RepID=A0A1J5QAI6_9ZZZZ
MRSTARRLWRFAVRIWPLLAALHGYIGWRLLPPLPGPARIAGAGLLVASALLIPAGLFSRLRPGRWSDAVAWAGYFALGLFSSTLVLTVLRDLVLLLPASDGWVEPSAALVPALALAVSLLGLRNARRTARVVEVDVELPALPDALVGFTIVQLSDIHVGPTIKAGRVRAMVDRVNALQADLIAITGDVVDGPVAVLRRDTEPLAALRARHGAWLVTGNHEYYAGVDAWIAEFERLGLRCLLNAHTVIAHGDAQLVLAGVTDFGAHAFDPQHRSDPALALAGSPDGAPRILLAHQPASAADAARAGFDLQLSGHTHGGQFWPWNLFVRLQQPFTAGLHRVDSMQVYTSRGTGYWGPPKRFGAPSEITRIRLRAAPDRRVARDDASRWR